MLTAKKFITIGAALLLLVPMLIQCEKNESLELQDADYFIFGHYYGFCGGEQCVEVFMINNESVYEETGDRYPYERKLVPSHLHRLDDQKYRRAKNLLDQIPTSLFTVENSHIGCPDCADGGGVYIEISRDGKKQYWYIDNTKSNTPEYLHHFIDEVHTTIALIQ